jgi:serine protease inhibitor
MHRTIIEVAEESTEAAAARRDWPCSGSGHSAFHTRAVQCRPFLFYITDDVTGAVLFAGAISDPR